MFGSEYDELIDRARLGSAYDNQLSDIAEERLPVPDKKRSKREKPATIAEQFEADLLEDAILLPMRRTTSDPDPVSRLIVSVGQKRPRPRI
jgi:hypothetical protein